MKVLRRWPYAVALSLDLLVSALFFGAPWETISARLARKKGLDHWLCEVLDVLVWTLFRQKRHCEIALAAYRARERAADALSG